MSLPLPVGAALMVEELARFRDWLIAEQRDLELQDFLRPEVLLADWRARVAAARAALDGFTGRLGIHGPFIGLDIDNPDPEVAPIVTRRLLTALDACAALGATQMVIHSPYTMWDHHNFDSARPDRPHPREARIAAVHDVLAPVVRRGSDAGVTLVIENIADIDPDERLALARSFDSAAVRVSLDTGHAHYAHGSCGAPTVDHFVNRAGSMLAHVHLQDADGHGDRHWAPGRGTVSWHAVFAALAALPQRPNMVLELADSGHIPAAMAYLAGEGLAR